MSIINKTAVLNPLLPIMDNIVDYIPRATTSVFGMVAIGSGINVDHLGRIYLDTQEFTDRLTAIDAHVAATLATQKSEVAAAIAQVNLTQSQTITALTLEVSTLQTNLTDSITATQTDLINRADQLAQDVTDITVQLTQDKAIFTQDIQDALDYLKSESSVASALRYPRKINGTYFDAKSDITTNAWGATRTFKIGNKTNSINGTTNVDFSLADIGAFPDVGGTIQGNVEVTGNLSVDGTISATLEGNAGTATKLQTPRTINGVSFDGSANITLPLATTSVSGTVQLNNTLTSTSTGQALTAAQGKVLNDNKLAKTENAVSASKLETSRTISLTGGVTGSVSFDGSANASIATTVTGLGAANGIATLDSNGQVPSTQLPSYVDDVLEYESVAAFPTTGVAGKIYVETTGNTTYRWGGTSYVKITSGEVSSVAGKVGVVTLTKSDVGLANVDNTSDTSKIVASASKLTTARTLSWTGDATGSLSFNGTADVAAALSLANSGVAAGTYKSVTVDTKGRVTGGNDVVTGLVTSTAATGTTNVATTNTNTFLNITENIGSATTTVGTSSQITGAGTITVASDAAGKITITGSQSITGNAATATKLATARNITLSGAVEGSTSFDGSSNVGISVTIPSVGNPDGIATLDSSGKLPTTQMPTYTSTVSGRSGDVTLTKADVGLANVDNTADSVKSVSSAAKLTTARTIGGVSFDGTANVNLPGVNTAGNQSTTGNASTASTLQSARTINGTSFNGSANITTANWGTARTLTLGSTGKSVNGSAEVAWTVDEILPAGTNGHVLKHNGTSWVSSIDSNTAMSAEDANAGTATTAQVITAAVLKGAIQTHAPVQTTVTGNAATATKLQTARTIGGVSFDGSANISLPGVNTAGNQSTSGNAATATALQTARTINGVSFNGTANIEVPVKTVKTTELETDALSESVFFRSDSGAGTLGVHIQNPTSSAFAYQITQDSNYDSIGLKARVKNGGTWSGYKSLAFTDSSITGNAASATKLQTARTIGGVSFDGSANINLPGVNAAGNQSTSGNAATATTLQTARTIAISGAVTGTATSFNGSANIAIATTAIDGSKISTGTIPAARIPTLNQATTGNAATATALATARTINGVSFNGTANITVADGTKLPLAGGTLTGAFKVNNTTASTSATTGAITTTGGVGIGGALFTTGAITSANNITAYSDSRIKDNITLIDDALNKVNQLKGVTYNRTDIGDKDKRYVGLIAQDVQTVMPEAVNVNKDELNTLSVDYQGLVGLLVESIKELKLEIDELKEKVK